MEQRRKNKWRDYKENYIWKEDYITISKKPRLKNNQGKNWKNKLTINAYLNNLTELNEPIYAGAKLVSDKIGAPLKNTNRNLKPRRKIQLESQIRN